MPTNNISTEATSVITDVHTMTTTYLNDLITDGFLYVNGESILDELHERAAEENQVRDVTAVLETWEVQALLLAANREKQPLLIEELTRRGAAYHTS